MITLYNQNIWNYLPSEYRNTLVRSLVADCDADICTFQECGPLRNRVGDAPIQELMADVYDEVRPEFADRNYTPVFYKKDKYILKDSGYFLYSGFNDANSKSVTWALFEEKVTNFTFIVMSTHFWWKEEGEENNLQRINNAVELKAKCDELVYEYNVPIIIGGDFNNGKDSLQGDEPYRKMLEFGFCDIRLTASETTDTYTHHDYPVLMEDGVTYGPCSDFDCNIDYIFTYGTKTVKALKYDVLTTDKALSSSDHCPVLGYFESEVI